MGTGGQQIPGTRTHGEAGTGLRNTRSAEPINTHKHVPGVRNSGPEWEAGEGGCRTRWGQDSLTPQKAKTHLCATGQPGLKHPLHGIM